MPIKLPSSFLPSRLLNAFQWDQKPVKRTLFVFKVQLELENFLYPGTANSRTLKLPYLLFLSILFSINWFCNNFSLPGRFISFKIFYYFSVCILWTEFPSRRLPLRIDRVYFTVLRALWMETEGCYLVICTIISGPLSLNSEAGKKPICVIF